MFKFAILAIVVIIAAYVMFQYYTGQVGFNPAGKYKGPEDDGILQDDDDPRA